MPDPIDYWNSNGKVEPTESPQPYSPSATARPLKAVPIEFDSLLTRTTDLAAAQAIVGALDKAQIRFHESDDGKIADREILLYVRSADQIRAATLAAEIFARRKKIKAFPRIKPLPKTGPTLSMDPFSFLP